MQHKDLSLQDMSIEKYPLHGSVLLNHARVTRKNCCPAERTTEYKLALNYTVVKG